MGIHADGAEGRDVYVDAIDEAYRRATRGVKPRRPRRRLNDIAVRQMRLVEKQQRVLSKALRRPKGEVCGGCGRQAEIPADQVPAIVSASSDITNQIERLSRTIREGHKLERESMGGLTLAEIKQVFKLQLERIAPELDDDDKRILLAHWFGDQAADLLLKPRPETP